MPALCRIIAQCGRLEQLIVTGNKISEAKRADIARAVVDSESLKEVRCALLRVSMTCCN